jgi:hypothetical protein
MNTLTKDEKNTILFLLVLQAMLIFIASFTYLIVDPPLLGRFIFGSDEEDWAFFEKAEFYILIITIICIPLSLFIILKRGLVNDTLTYSIIYIILASSSYVYDKYLKVTKTNPKIQKFLHRFKHFNKVTLFLVSIYIIKYVFF